MSAEAKNQGLLAEVEAALKSDPTHADLLDLQADLIAWLRDPVTRNSLYPDGTEFSHGRTHLSVLLWGLGVDLSVSIAP